MLSFLKWFSVCLAASTGYFFASRLGFAFNFASYPISVMWLANAVVLSALLLTPVRVWWLLLLFVFPAHVAAQAGDHVPWPLLLSRFVSNSFESVLGAALTRMFMTEKIQFDRLRDICIFYLCGALPSVSVSTVLDSAFVTLNDSHPGHYWDIFTIRFSSNFFAAVTVVPLIVAWSTSLSSPRIFSSKNLDAALLIIGLLGASLISFIQLHGGMEMASVSLCLALPLFIWAAVRFGVRGVSAGILGVAIFTTWANIHQRGPFTGGSAQENALSLLAFFTSLSVILVPMAALVAEKKNVSEALRASEQRNRLAMDTQSELLCCCFADTTLTFVNDSWCRFFGRSRAQLMGKKILDLVPAAVHERLLCHFAQTIVHQRPVLWESEALVAGRNVTWQQWIIYPIISDDRHVREIQAVGRDITERKRAEEALRKSEERYREVAETQSDLVFRYLPDFTLIFVNQAFCNFFGSSRIDLIGRKFTDLLPPEARGKFQDSLNASSPQTQPFVWEYPLRGADGNTRWYQWRCRATTNSAGQLTATQAVARDISSQKQAEEANRKLAHVSRLATIGELTAIIAHEVSQPLNAILTNVEAGELVARQDPPPITELLTILGDIRRDNLRAVEAIRCVRAFSKKNDTQKSVVHLHALIEDVLQLVGGEISRRRIQVHTHMGGDLPTVLGDRLGLQQVVLNLIVNAMDALDELPESERLLWIGAENTGKEVLVSIKDNGKGLPAGIVGQSFESFFTTKREGLGLGLSVSRSIVQAHGGSLRAENNKTRGATFSFTLPLNPPAEP